MALVVGLGSQMVSWSSVFCRKLAAAGHFVLRFDIRHMADTHRRFAGGSEKFDASVIGDISARAFDRCVYPEGTARHYAAIVSAGSRQRALAGVTLPTLVLHGNADTLLTPEHGRATADAVPGAVFCVIRGLGHGPAYPLLRDEIVAAIAARTVAGRRSG